MNGNKGQRFSESGYCQKNVKIIDSLTDRIAVKVYREVEILKMDAILIAMPKTFMSALQEDKELGCYYKKVVSLFDLGKYTLEDIGDMYMVYAFIKAMQARFSGALPHFYRVSEICVDLGREMGLTRYDVGVLQALGVMHDVGKLGISDEILFKQGCLSATDWDEIKRHSAIGYRLVRPVHGISELADLILAHHERWDGEGYPYGLRKEEIPLVCRILTLADSVDAMINDRPYRKALTPSQIVTELHSCSGSQFDPAVVEAFFDMIQEHHHRQPFLSPLREGL